VDKLLAIAEMYAKGLGFAVLAEFKDHRAAMAATCYEIACAESSVEMSRMG